MTTDFIKEIETTAVELRGILNSFSSVSLQQIPFEGSWSGAQLAEHVIKSAEGIPLVLSGKSKNAERDPEQMIPMIKSIFLEFNTKMTSPEFVRPSDNPPAKNLLLTRFDVAFDKIKRVSQQVNLADLFTAFSIPQMGELTGYEWLCFVYCHTKRHTVQAQKIYDAVTANSKLKM